MVAPQPQQHHRRAERAVDMAAGLKDVLGDDALESAKNALAMAGEMQSTELIDLWAEVCAILATDQVIEVRLG